MVDNKNEERIPLCQSVLRDLVDAMLLRRGDDKLEHFYWRTTPPALRHAESLP